MPPFISQKQKSRIQSFESIFWKTTFELCLCQLCFAHLETEIFYFAPLLQNQASSFMLHLRLRSQMLWLSSLTCIKTFIRSSHSSSRTNTFQLWFSFFFFFFLHLKHKTTVLWFHSAVRRWVAPHYMGDYQWFPCWESAEKHTTVELRPPLAHCFFIKLNNNGGGSFWYKTSDLISASKWPRKRKHTEVYGTTPWVQACMLILKIMQVRLSGVALLFTAFAVIFDSCGVTELHKHKICTTIHCKDQWNLVPTTASFHNLWICPKLWNWFLQLFFKPHFFISILSIDIHFSQHGPVWNYDSMINLRKNITVLRCLGIMITVLKGYFAFSFACFGMSA